MAQLGDEILDALTDGGMSVYALSVGLLLPEDVVWDALNRLRGLGLVTKSNLVWEIRHDRVD